MNVYEFSKLDCGAQIDLLQKEGVFIGKRRINQQAIVLYQFHAFYVEIVYLKYRLVVASIRCSVSTRILEPYLDAIDIGEFTRSHRLY